MSDLITATGVVANTPRTIVTGGGLPITSFRLASVTRRFDRTSSRWVDGDTNWYTVTAFRHVANNITSSISSGERVMVMGRLRIRPWQNGDRSGTTVEIEATAIGHDLAFGTSMFTRTSVGASVGAGAGAGAGVGVGVGAGASAGSSASGSSSSSGSRAESETQPPSGLPGLEPVESASGAPGSYSGPPSGSGTVDPDSADAGPVDADSVDADSVDPDSADAGPVVADSVVADSVDRSGEWAVPGTEPAFTSQQGLPTASDAPAVSGAAGSSRLKAAGKTTSEGTETAKGGVPVSWQAAHNEVVVPF